MRQLDRATFGPWALVTGASSGIGAAFARMLAAAGFNLVLVARRRDELGSLARELSAAFQVECKPVALDLAAPDFLGALRAETDALDVGLVISNAGVATAAPLVEWEASDLERDVAVNVLAHVRLLHHFGQRLARRGRGGVLLVSSIAGRQPVPYLATYSAAKSFVTLLGASAHRELADAGVTVSVLVAGPTDTPMRTVMGFGRSRLRPISAEQCAREGLETLARGRASHIPGVQARLAMSLVPRALITRVLGTMTRSFIRGSRVLPAGAPSDAAETAARPLRPPR